MSTSPSTKSSKPSTKTPASKTSSAKKTLNAEDLLDETPADGKETTTTEAPAKEVAEPEGLLNRLTTPTSPVVDPTASPAEKDGSAQFELPICLDTEETTDNPASIKLVVEAFNKNCLKCSHLIPEASTEFETCHFSQGNTSCPAQSVKIVFVGMRQHYVKRLQEARDTQDSNRVLRILAKLEAESLEVKEYVLRKVGLMA